MKAIILAAGIGNRMQPLTRVTHKTLLTVAGKAVINWIIDALTANGILDIVIVTGYMADQLTGHLAASYPGRFFRYVHNERYSSTNNIFSLALAMEQVDPDSDLIFIESDLIVEPAVIARVIGSHYPDVAIVDRFRLGMDGTVVTIEEGRITSVIPSHLQGADFDFTDKFKTVNIYRFSKEFCERSFRRLLTFYAKAIDDTCYYELILGIIIYMQKEVIHAEVLDGERWAEIDDPNDLETARFAFEPDSRRELLARNHGGYWNFDILDFAYIRNAHFPTPAVFAELRTGLVDFASNYGSAQPLLDKKLAYFVLCDSSRLILLNGASQGIPMIAQYLQHRRVLVPSPTFGEYHRLFPQAHTYDDHGQADIGSILQSARRDDAVVFVNPNNPTGTVIASEAVYDLAARHPKMIVVVDESFIDFAGMPSIVELLERSPLLNVIVIKSLSKALGVPGLRLGFLYSANPDFLDFCRRQVPVWNANAIAEGFLEIVLKHRSAIGDSFRRTIADREDFANRLAELAVIDHVFPSGGNFLLVRFHLDRASGARLANDLLRRSRIHVKDVSDRIADNRAYWRIAVRTAAENAEFVNGLRNAADGTAGIPGFTNCDNLATTGRRHA